MSLQRVVTQAFIDQFGGEPTIVVRAPGRVNLIGEHTDYNEGFVMPMAIDRAVWMAIRPREDLRVWIKSLEMDEPADFALDAIEKGSGWQEYVKGMAWALLEDGYDLSGWEGIVSSDVPVGAGLSSSAALEMATAQAFMAVSGQAWDAVKMAQLGQKTENQWMGANTGIMDQMISASGVADHALLIDCRDLSSRQIPLPENTVIVILDTMTRHTHTDSGYNERRAQCEQAAAFFEVPFLRDVALDEYKARKKELDQIDRDRVVSRRAKHVISENARVLESEKVMYNGDAHLMGLLMNSSHASLRDDFEVTNAALDMMAALAQEAEGCYGARMTGGGFGGCAVALVHVDYAESFANEVARDYRDIQGLVPMIYICKATDGTKVIER
ncbi:MAG: galactokinase [Chloroflexota bacterium]